MKQLLPSCFSIAAACLLVSGAAQANPVVGMAERAPAIDHSDRKVVPSGFEENKGQVLTITGEVAPFVRYRLSQGNTNIFLLGSGIAYQFSQRHYPEGYAELEKDARLNPAKQRELDALNKEVMLETYRMDVLLDGANTDARITTEDRSADHTQYYGQNALDVHTYSRVTYHEVYPGIDWVVYTTAKGMKYDFVLRPGSDPAMIQLRFKDHEELRLDGDGQLVHGNRMGRFTEEQPVSFQNGKEVGTSFVLEGDRLSFALDSYDRSQPLTIDPDRIWGTYYGGAGSEYNISCAADGSGNVYLSGNTGSLTGIASGGYQTTYGGGDDAFLVKFNADGVRQWGTYYGGAGLEYSGSCVVDDGGNVYLVGTTTSTATIASGGYQNTLGGSRDAFLVKFNASGVRQWATYYGGSDFDSGLSCAIDGSGNIYLVGYTSSITSVAFGGHQNTIGGGYDGFLVKFNSVGVRQWATYYGGTSDDQFLYCALDQYANLYVVGTSNSNTAISYYAHQGTRGGGTDAFLVKFTAGGARYWATYYGGTGDDSGLSCALDSDDNVYLAGTTASNTAIASGGHQNTYGGGDTDAFLAKFSTAGVRQWGTYYGGAEGDNGDLCVVDGDKVFLVGSTYSATAIASDGFQMAHAGGYTDAFLVRFNVDGMRQWGTYYGGSGVDDGTSCAVDGSGNVYLAGYTGSGNVISFGGHQSVLGGDLDAYLVKFEGGFVGIGEVSPLERQPSIWPNPNAGDRLFFDGQGAGSADIQFFDALGKLQRTEHIRSTGDRAPVEIAVGDLASGVYLVNITVNGGSTVQRLSIIK